MFENFIYLQNAIIGDLEVRIANRKNNLKLRRQYFLQF